MISDECTDESMTMPHLINRDAIRASVCRLIADETSIVICCNLYNIMNMGPRNLGIVKARDPCASSLPGRLCRTALAAPEKFTEDGSFRSATRAAAMMAASLSLSPTLTHASATSSSRRRRYLGVRRIVWRLRNQLRHTPSIDMGSSLYVQ